MPLREAIDVKSMGLLRLDQRIESMKAIMSLSFRLNDAETRYSNPERKYLAVLRCLAEVW
jgi:hypothetical protein